LQSLLIECKYTFIFKSSPTILAIFALGEYVNSDFGLYFIVRHEPTDNLMPTYRLTYFKVLLSIYLSKWDKHLWRERASCRKRQLW